MPPIPKDLEAVPIKELKKILISRNVDVTVRAHVWVCVWLRMRGKGIVRLRLLVVTTRSVTVGCVCVRVCVFALHEHVPEVQAQTCVRARLTPLSL